jgi:hypothetical protein
LLLRKYLDVLAEELRDPEAPVEGSPRVTAPLRPRTTASQSVVARPRAASVPVAAMPDAVAWRRPFREPHGPTDQSPPDLLRPPPLSWESRT